MNSVASPFTNLEPPSMDPKHHRPEEVLANVGKSRRVDVEEEAVLGAYDASSAGPVHLIVFMHITILIKEKQNIHSLCDVVRTVQPPVDTVLLLLAYRESPTKLNGQ